MSVQAGVTQATEAEVERMWPKPAEAQAEQRGAREGGEGLGVLRGGRLEETRVAKKWIGWVGHKNLTGTAC
eukprot:3329458-Pleurochrysis_carterae.AAC.1